MARPTKWTPALGKRLLEYLEAGNTRKDAYLSAGISAKTFAAWLARRHPFEKGAETFYEQVQRAEARARMRNVTYLNKAALKDWRAALAFLERRDPDTWKPRSQVDVVDLRKMLSDMTEEEIQAVENLARKAAQSRGD